MIKNTFILAIGMMFLPTVSSAQIASEAGGGEDFQTLLENILTFANDVLIPFIIGIGFLVFVWGMFKYFIAGGADEGKREEGKSLMIYATLGFVLIIVFWGIVNLLTDSLFTETEIDGPDNLPGIPGVTPGADADS
ncbi:MAG: Type secretion system pilin [Candidatus Parcubacteria bacterium]|jgi:ABC-type Na+ efflux pump permease subunit